MAHFEKSKSGNWVAHIKIGQIRKSKTFPKKSEATSWARKEESTLEKNKSRSTTQRSLHELLDLYRDKVAAFKKSQRSEIIRINRFKKELDNISLNKVTKQWLMEWVETRLITVSPDTVNRDLNTLSAAFQYAHTELEWINSNPVREVKRPKKSKPRDRLISQQEIDRILSALNYADGTIIATKMQELAILFLLAIETGMRMGELLSLEWGRVLIDKRFVVLLDTKNGDRREVPLSQKACQLLNHLKEACNTQKCFSMSTEQASALFRKYVNKIGIPDLHFHDTRHEALTRLSKKLDVLELCRVIGHRDPRSLMIYYNETAETIATKLD